MTRVVISISPATTFVDGPYVRLVLDCGHHLVDRAADQGPVQVGDTRECRWCEGPARQTDSTGVGWAHRHV